MKKWQNTSHLENQDAKAELVEIFPDLFSGIGTLPGEYSIELKKDTKPLHLPARNVTEALYQPLKRELGRMVKIGSSPQCMTPQTGVII